MTDSYGLLTVALAQGSAAETLDLATGDEIVLVPLDDDEVEPGVPVTVPVSLGRRSE